MTAIKSAQADRFVADPPAGMRLFLVYGADAGGITERARALEAVALRRGKGDTVLRFGSDQISADPALLGSEAHAMSLFGGEAVIALRILDGRHNVLDPLRALLANPPAAATVIVEAGELKRDSALLKAFEGSAAAAAVATFALERRELGPMIDAMARESGVTVQPEARELLAESLAGDRSAARREIEKLFLYAADAGSITRADVVAIVADVADADTDEILEAALAGKAEELERGMNRLRAEGGSAAALLAAALRHLTQLSALAETMQTERIDAAAAAGRARPPIFGRRQAAVAAQLRHWSAPALAEARRRIAAAILQTRQYPGLDLAAASAALHDLASRGSAGRTRDRF